MVHLSASASSTHAGTAVRHPPLSHPPNPILTSPSHNRAAFSRSQSQAALLRRQGIQHRRPVRPRLLGTPHSMFQACPSYPSPLCYSPINKTQALLRLPNSIHDLFLPGRGRLARQLDHGPHSVEPEPVRRICCLFRALRRAHRDRGAD